VSVHVLEAKHGYTTRKIDTVHTDKCRYKIRKQKRSSGALYRHMPDSAVNVSVLPVITVGNLSSGRLRLKPRGP
jgi:hypothetical protein